MSIERPECAFGGCRRPARARGWCYTHYSRWRVHGDVNTVLRLPSDDPQRFWMKVDRDRPAPGHAPELGACWEWIASRNEHGYGEFFDRGKVRKAHRVSYEMEYGELPDTKPIDHRCRNRACVRPTHLRPVTNKQNSENQHLSSTNTSGYRGVSWNKNRMSWGVAVSHEGRRYFGGYFADVHEAGRAAREMRNKLFTHNDMDRR